MRFDGGLRKTLLTGLALTALGLIAGGVPLCHLFGNWRTRRELSFGGFDQKRGWSPVTVAIILVL